MSDTLRRLARAALGTERVAQPRLPYRFEGTGAGDDLIDTPLPMAPDSTLRDGVEPTVTPSVVAPAAHGTPSRLTTPIEARPERPQSSANLHPRRGIPEALVELHEIDGVFRTAPRQGADPRTISRVPTALLPPVPSGTLAAEPRDTPHTTASAPTPLQEEEPAVVVVNIGRIDVRAATLSTPSVKRRPPAEPLALADYLAGKRR